MRDSAQNSNHAEFNHFSNNSDALMLSLARGLQVAGSPGAWVPLYRRRGRVLYLRHCSAGSAEKQPKFSGENWSAESAGARCMRPPCIISHPSVLCIPSVPAYDPS